MWTKSTCSFVTMFPGCLRAGGVILEEIDETADLFDVELFVFEE